MKNIVRKEIGSEFWDVPTGGKGNALFPKETCWFVSGTAALEYIIGDMQKQAPIHRIGVPSWCCSCMIHPFLDAGLEVVFYPVYVDDQGKLSCDYECVSGCDATLVLTYFGYQKLNTIGTPGGILIRDLTHGLFGPWEQDAQYYFGSLRKWVGVWTGGYAWKKGAWISGQSIPPVEESYLRTRETAMERKLSYLQGLSEEKDYLDLFEEAEEFLDQCGIRGSCARDMQCAADLDAEYIRQRRRENARLLLSELKDLALFPELGENDCPMFVPILLPDRNTRDELRRFLISKEIYCPVHWPVSDLHSLGEKERFLYDRSLSVVCDQRYDLSDMGRILDAIGAYRASKMEC